jgi:uncharacterized protein YndB with AHSA1/START domain
MTSGGVVRWRIHLRAAPQAVFAALATDAGRARFWAESAAERDGVLQFRFSNGQRLDAPILAMDAPRRFRVAYFGGSTATFDLAPDGAGGTDLTLTETDVPVGELEQNRAGWISVLLSLKAAVDHGVDLRNHDPARTWEQGYVDV